MNLVVNLYQMASVNNAMVIHLLIHFLEFLGEDNLKAKSVYFSCLPIQSLE